MIATIIILILVFIYLLVAAHEHGKEQTKKRNFWEALLAMAVQLMLFYYAGLFDKFIK